MTGKAFSMAVIKRNVHQITNALNLKTQHSLIIMEWGRNSFIWLSVDFYFL